MRRLYLDNIRWATVLLVMVYHVFYVFNAVGVMGGVGNFCEVQYQDGFLYFVYPWFMVLLFTIAGMSAKYALEKMSVKDFLQKRTWKLLVPSTLGLFAYQWIVGYYNIKIGGGLEYIPSFLIYPISAVSGTGPLWFAQVLWLFSLFLLLIRRIDKNEYLWKAGGKCNAYMLILFFLLIWCGAQILNMPVITTYRFGIYLAAFLLGYFVLSHDNAQEILEKICLPMLLTSVVMGIVYTIFYFGENYADAIILKSLFTNVYAWFMTLAVLGCGKKWFNRQNAFSVYMTKRSYGFYVLHYTFISIPCSLLKNHTDLPIWIVYAAALLIVFTGTPVLYEVISRIPIARCFILGIRIKHDKR
ncbi:MAG: acyltransferase [Blautia sp.]|nr:acyltransferase [Lachnoclostridium sp.]MCM1211434.1 acyltransferase [Blautia sp.]